MATTERAAALYQPIALQRPIGTFAAYSAPEPVARPRVVLSLLAILAVVAAVAAWMWFGGGFATI
jgi:hypothetical protein